jgi:hypothetical protein
VQALFYLLPTLLCPLSMVVMLWMLRRNSGDGAGAEHNLEAVPAPASRMRAGAATLWRWLQCCVNWRVGLALVLVGTGIWAVAPNRVGAAVPLLVLLLCPLSMLLMLWGGHRGHQCAPTATTTTTLSQPETLQDNSLS